VTEAKAKNLLFICGPNGIGKTTAARAIVQKCPGFAYVDSDACRVMNPFVLDDVTIPTVAQNIADMIRNYLRCPAVETVVFTYGFHGRRREVFARVMELLESEAYRFLPLLLCCGEEENIRRMAADVRSAERVRITLEHSRRAFDDVPYPQVDVTELTVEATADAILRAAGLA